MGPTAMTARHGPRCRCGRRVGAYSIYPWPAAALEPVQVVSFPSRAPIASINTRHGYRARSPPPLQCADWALSAGSAVRSRLRAERFARHARAANRHRASPAKLRLRNFYRPGVSPTDPAPASSGPSSFTRLSACGVAGRRSRFAACAAARASAGCRPLGFFGIA